MVRVRVFGAARSRRDAFAAVSVNQMARHLVVAKLLVIVRIVEACPYIYWGAVLRALAAHFEALIVDIVLPVVIVRWVRVRVRVMVRCVPRVANIRLKRG